MTTQTTRYQDWHLPLSKDHITLREAHRAMQNVGAEQKKIPLMVQLIENPKFSLPGVTLFHGAVSLEQHDYIHLVLGRGLMPKDEAFTIGFTMGTTNNVSTTEEKLFSWVSKVLYPSEYQFDEDDIKIFKDAVRLGFISDCAPLDQFDFKSHLDQPLGAIRGQLQLDVPLLEAYYRIEKRRYPSSPESQRLV